MAAAGGAGPPAAGPPAADTGATAGDVAAESLPEPTEADKHRFIDAVPRAKIILGSRKRHFTCATCVTQRASPVRDVREAKNFMWNDVFRYLKLFRPETLLNSSPSERWTALMQAAHVTSLPFICEPLFLVFLCAVRIIGAGDWVLKQGERLDVVEYLVYIGADHRKRSGGKPKLPQDTGTQPFPSPL